MIKCLSLVALDFAFVEPLLERIVGVLFRRRLTPSFAGVASGTGNSLVTLQVALIEEHSALRQLPSLIELLFGALTLQQGGAPANSGSSGQRGLVLRSPRVAKAMAVAIAKAPPSQLAQLWRIWCAALASASAATLGEGNPAASAAASYALCTMARLGSVAARVTHIRGESAVKLRAIIAGAMRDLTPLFANQQLSACNASGSTGRAAAFGAILNLTHDLAELLQRCTIVTSMAGATSAGALSSPMRGASSALRDTLVGDAPLGRTAVLHFAKRARAEGNHNASSSGSGALPLVALRVAVVALSESFVTLQSSERAELAALVIADLQEACAQTDADGGGNARKRGCESGSGKGKTEATRWALLTQSLPVCAELMSKRALADFVAWLVAPPAVESAAERSVEAAAGSSLAGIKAGMLSNAALYEIRALRAEVNVGLSRVLCESEAALSLNAIDGGAEDVKLCSRSAYVHRIHEFGSFLRIMNGLPVHWLAAHSGWIQHVIRIEKSLGLLVKKLHGKRKGIDAATAGAFYFYFPLYDMT